jgi:symplekin
VSKQPEIALGPFKLPQPPPLTLEESAQASKGTVGRVLGMISTHEDPSLAMKRQQKLGLHRIAGSNYDKSAWTTVITRLATRAEVPEESDVATPTSLIKLENKALQRNKFSISHTIRESLYLYILEDFRRRVDIAITWLNEEWFNERVLRKAEHASAAVSSTYETYLTKLVTSLLPYLDSRSDTKLLIRFLSEIPAIPPTVLSLVATLAKDPERVVLCVSALHYLVLMRPPAREAVLDQLEEIYRDEEGARKAVSKVLGKWRPGAVAIEGRANGMKTEGST